MTLREEIEKIILSHMRYGDYGQTTDDILVLLDKPEATVEEIADSLKENVRIDISACVGGIGHSTALSRDGYLAIASTLLKTFKTERR